MEGMNDYSLGLTRDRLREWLAGADQIPTGGDIGFADDGETAAPPDSAGKILRPAAVLILVVNRADAPYVLFTQRTAHLTDHAGQISFPGGRVEASDRDYAHTALRETEEETGLPASNIEVLGAIPQYTTGTGYLITPVVGWVDGPVEYTPDPKEVAECFEVPFGFVTDVRNHRTESAMYKGRMRKYMAVPYGKRYIWGATAGMLVSLTRVLASANGSTYEPPIFAAPDSGR
jgi:8-oxo-dGTP pyrophosphatase MutT (NUDIX family)